VRHLALLCPRQQLAATVAAACNTYSRGAAPLGLRGAALAFCATREAAQALADAASVSACAARADAPLRVACLHGGLPQTEREAALAALRGGDVDLLVATDVCSRGLDIPGVELVVHAESPADGDAYTHRAGRAGRPGCASAGVSLLLYRPDEGRALGELERAAGVAFMRISSLEEDATRPPRSYALGGATGVRAPDAQREAAATGNRLLVTDRMAMLTADLAELGARQKGKRGGGGGGGGGSSSGGAQRMGGKR
jgi:superfamily II DNA/RNA helicase